jgi:hypothetical protein
MAAIIEAFIDPRTGTSTTLAQEQAALMSGSWGGLTPVDADGQPAPAGSTLSPHLQQIRADLLAGKIPLVAQPQNYLLWGAIAFGVWYFFIRGR